MAALAPHAAPREGSLGGTDPSVHNRVKQTFINPVATYPFIAARWKEGWEQSFHPGDLMFVFRGPAAEKSSKTVILANLPILNHIMASTDPALAQFKHYPDWNYIGVMRNSAVASGLSHRSSVGQRGGNRLAAERIINVDVRGSTRMFNYWEDAQAGGHLHLVWRLCSIDERHGSMQVAQNDPLNPRDKDPDGWSRDPKDGQYVHTDGTKQRAPPPGARLRVWQLLPYTTDYTTDKIWWNTQAMLNHNYRRPISVGFVFQSLGQGELSDDAIAIRKATQMVNERFKLPMIHAFLRV
jgi:hypothetical protein